MDGEAPEEFNRLAWKQSDRDRRFDRGVRVVVAEDKILEAEIVDAVYRAVQLHPRKWPEFARQLLVRLLEMVPVKVQAAEDMDEFGGPQIYTCAIIIVSNAYDAMLDVGRRSLTDLRRG